MSLDPLFGNSRENMLYQCSYIGEADPADPYLSPLFGDFSGFPPMLMQVEITRCCSVTRSLCQKRLKRPG